MRVEFIDTGVEYGTERPIQIARVVGGWLDQYVLLVCRFTDDGSSWFPTWLGRNGEEPLRIPAELVALSPDVLEALERMAT